MSFDELERFTSVTSIAQSCFEGCTSLARISFHNGITSVGYNSFKNTTSLAIDISFPNLKTLNSAFTNSGIISVSNLGKITQLVGVDNNNATFLNCKSLQEVVVPETVTSIGKATFKGCTALTDINFPTGITAIAENALNGCTSLVIDDLSLPNLASLGSNAFYDVSIRKISNLGKITALPAASYSTKNFGKKDVLEEVVLPDTLTSIPDSGVRGYTALNSINIPQGVTIIGVSAFAGNTNMIIEDLSLPNLTSLGKNSFWGTKIKKVSNLGSITTLAGGANTDGPFNSCNDLRSVRLPVTLTSIGELVFYGCTLDELIMDATTPPTLGSFRGTINAIYVPDASVTAYREATNWSAYADRILPLSEYAE